MVFAKTELGVWNQVILINECSKSGGDDAFKKLTDWAKEADGTVGISVCGGLFSLCIGMTLAAFQIVGK